MKRLIVSSIFALTGLLGTVGSAQSPSPNNNIQDTSSNVAADIGVTKRLCPTFAQPADYCSYKIFSINMSKASSTP